MNSIKKQFYFNRIWEVNKFVTYSNQFIKEDFTNF